MQMVSKRARHRAIRIGIALMPVLVWMSWYSVAHAELKLAGIFSDHMVLQRERSVPVWGWADKGQFVTVRFADQSVSAKVDDDGTWQAILKPLAASNEARKLVATCDDETVVVADIVVGDIWHASGQSNMAMNVQAVAKHFSKAEADMAAAKLPTIRFRRIDEPQSAAPGKDIPLKAGWSICSPSTVGGFSAAAFYFARKLQRELDVPIGIVDTSRGGTPIEPFIPRAAFKSQLTLVRELELGDQEDLLGIWKMPGGVRARDANWLPGRLFHSRLAPINRFAVRGAVWYQGESNCGDGEDPRDYRHKMRALITGWRTELGDDDLPFYFVQLPGSGARMGWPYLREQQRLSLGLPHTGMAVTIDLFHQDIHPPNKKDVGERLALLALADEYGRKIPSGGPLFDRVEIADGRAVVSFTHVESGLMTAIKDGLAEPKEDRTIPLKNFELADQAGTWHPADATIDGATVIVRNERLPRPAAVRYAYAINPQHCRLYNRDGLPAAPFCSHPELLKFEPDLPKEKGERMNRLVILAVLCSPAWVASAAETRPNIVVILADDLGYGDLGCYNRDSKIPTPHLDRLATSGMRFTDSHSPSSVCSPTRYALLTGRYAWRTRLQRGVLGPWSPPLIAPEQLTVPALLKQHGYATGCIGKWHLGWEWPTKDGKPPANGADNLSNVDFTKPIANGPTTRGFDFYFGTDVPNYAPFCFIENDRTVGIPTIPFGPRKGPALPGWDWVNVLPELTKQAVRFVEERAKAKQPFFLYFPLTSPHYPVVPAPEFKGKSGAGDYGDFVFQSDWTVGQVLDALERSGVADNTLVIFTSDNGPEISNEVHPGAYDRIQKYSHSSMGTLRGAKRDVWEGGHRVPFLARWPGKIKPGSTCDETICHVDLMATLAALLNVKLPADAGVDSYNLLPAFLGEKLTQPIREATVHHAFFGKFAIRKGDWVLIAAPTGDDNGTLGEPDSFKKDRGYKPHDQTMELFDLRKDLAERDNVSANYPEVVKEMTELLRKYISEGRSTPGIKQSNDVSVRFDNAK